jgi:L-rhamnose-H+ transport protein
MKWTGQWAFENVWLIFASIAYLVCPWGLVLCTVPEVLRVYGSVSLGLLVTVFGFGIGWGIGALTFGLGVASVGMALGFAIILGLAASVGTIIPLLMLGNLASLRVFVSVTAVGVMLAGVAVCSFAGKWKEEAPKKGSILSYRNGIRVCVLSGLLSGCGNVGFVFGAPLADRAQALGVPSFAASNVVWLVLTSALFICNAGYAAVLLSKNATSFNFYKRGTAFNFFLAGLMGVLWIGGISLYGSGARQLGELGPSLGWSILMSTVVMVANLLGLATGEWRSAPAASKRRLLQGLALLLVAIAGLGYANQMK